MHIVQTHKISTKLYYDVCILVNKNNICDNEKCNNITTFVNLNKGYLQYCCLKCNANSNKFIDMIKRVHTNKIPTTTGKTYEEIYGIKKSIELKNNRSIVHKNKIISGEQKKKIRDTRIKRKCGRGPKNPMYGKTHNKEVKLKQSNYMLNGGAAYARSFLKRISKPQRKLFNLICQILPYPILEYPCMNKSIDIAVPVLSIAFEYDETYFHQDKEKDIIRQKLLENEGWRFIRYRDIPDLNEILIDVNKILEK